MSPGDPPPPVRLAPLGVADAPAAVALWNAAGLTRPWNDAAADFARAVAGPASAVIGAWDGDRLAGTAMVGHDGHRGWLYYLGVVPERRGRGIGRALLAAAEGWLRAASVPKLHLLVRDGNAAAGFYRQLGYERQEVAVWGRRLEEAP